MDERDKKTGKTISGENFNHLREQHRSNLRNQKIKELQADFWLWMNFQGEIQGIDPDNNIHKAFGAEENNDFFQNSLLDLFQRAGNSIWSKIEKGIAVNMLPFFKDGSHIQWCSLIKFDPEDPMEAEILLLGKLQVAAEDLLEYEIEEIHEISEIEAELPSRTFSEGSVITEKLFYLNEAFQVLRISEPLLMALNYKQDLSAPIPLAKILFEPERFLLAAKVANGKSISWIILDANGKQYNATLKLVEHKNLNPQRYEVGVTKMEHKHFSNGNGQTKRLQHILQYFPVPMILLSSDAKVLYFNEKAKFLQFRSNESFVNKISDLSEDDYMKANSDLLENLYVELRDFSFDLPDDDTALCNLRMQKLASGEVLIAILPLCDSGTEAARLELQLVEFQKKLAEIQQEKHDLEQANQQIPELQRQVDIAQGKNTLLKSEQERLKAKIEEIRNSRPSEDLQLKLNEAYEANKILLQEKENLQEQLSKSEEVQKAAEKELGMTLDEFYALHQKVLSELNSVTQQRDTLQLKVNELSQQIEVLRSEKSLMEADLQKSEELRLLAERDQQIAETEKNLCVSDNKKLISDLETSRFQIAALRKELAEPIPASADVPLENSLAFLSEAAKRLAEIQLVLTDGNEEEKTQALKLFGRYTYFLQQFADIHSGEVEEIDLIHFTQELQRRFINELPEELNFYTSYGSRLKPVAVNAKQLELLIKQLMENAREAVEPLGEEAEIKMLLRNKTVQGHASLKDGEYMLVQITDNGVGFEDSVDKALQPYYSQKEEHCGLGLTLVQYLVEKWGGKVLLSDNSEGAVVGIYLPVLTENFEEDDDAEKNADSKSSNEAAEADEAELSDGEINEAFEAVEGSEEAGEESVSQVPIYFFVSVNDPESQKHKDKLLHFGYRIVADIEDAEIFIGGVSALNNPSIMSEIMAKRFRLWLHSEEEANTIAAMMEQNRLVTEGGNLSLLRSTDFDILRKELDSIL